MQGQVVLVGPVSGLEGSLEDSQEGYLVVDSLVVLPLHSAVAGLVVRGASHPEIQTLSLSK